MNMTNVEIQSQGNEGNKIITTPTTLEVLLGDLDVLSKVNSLDPQILEEIESVRNALIILLSDLNDETQEYAPFLELGVKPEYWITQANRLINLNLNQILNFNAHHLLERVQKSANIGICVINHFDNQICQATTTLKYVFDDTYIESIKRIEDFMDLVHPEDRLALEKQLSKFYSSDSDWDIKLKEIS